jgi:hypothetical protein
MQRQFEKEKTQGNIARPGRPLENLICDTMGIGSRMTQDKYGDSFIHPPAPSSDVFGSQASNQGFRLRKPK